jgi:hypothetical protein
MICIVNSMLSNWGRWAVRGNDGGVGYPKMSPMFNNMPKGDSYSSHVFWVDQDILDTDKAINRLEPSDRIVCIEVYQKGGPVGEICARLNLAKRTYYDRLHRIHNELMGHINDISCGL